MAALHLPADLVAFLQAGEQLAASGSFKLREGVKVQAAEPAPAAAGK